MPLQYATLASHVVAVAHTVPGCKVQDITEITSPPQFGAAPVQIRPQRSFETAKAQVQCLLLILHQLLAQL